MFLQNRNLKTFERQIIHILTTTSRCSLTNYCSIVHEHFLFNIWYRVPEVNKADCWKVLKCTLQLFEEIYLSQTCRQVNDPLALNKTQLKALRNKGALYVGTLILVVTGGEALKGCRACSSACYCCSKQTPLGQLIILMVQCRILSPDICCPTTPSSTPRHLTGGDHLRNQRPLKPRAGGRAGEVLTHSEKHEREV